jgi:hypothetical protein
VDAASDLDLPGDHRFAIGLKRYTESSWPKTPTLANASLHRSSAAKVGPWNPVASEPEQHDRKCLVPVESLRRPDHDDVPVIALDGHTRRDARRANRPL